MDLLYVYIQRVGPLYPRAWVLIKALRCRLRTSRWGVCLPCPCLLKLCWLHSIPCLCPPRCIHFKKSAFAAPVCASCAICLPIYCIVYVQIYRGVNVSRTWIKMVIPILYFTKYLRDKKCAALSPYIPHEKLQALKVALYRLQILAQIPWQSHLRIWHSWWQAVLFATRWLQLLLKADHLM